MPSASARRCGFGYQLRPRSITGLVIASFAVVAAPLIVAIAASVFYVDSLHTQSARLVLRGVAVTRDSKRLTSLLISMERSALQYRILDKANLLSRFQLQAQAYRRELANLSALDLPTLPAATLDRLSADVAALTHELGTNDAATDDVIKKLARVRRRNAEIGFRGDTFVHEQLEQLQNTANQARRFLLICLFALVPVVIALGIFLTFVIARPLRQILDAINRLGAGEMSREVRINAPVVELDRLGDRLDWMRQRLSLEESEKQRFLRHMAHELKTPIASIREGAELLADGAVGRLNDAQHEVADIIGRNSLELVSLIDNLFEFTVWREQHARLEITRFDLARLIERVSERHRLVIRARGLVLNRPEGPIEITADRDRMELIVDNLVANAVKYAANGGAIDIRVKQNERGTDLYVADDGPGVAAADRERIFDAFVQGDNRPPEPTGVSGTGIGLSIVRECARAHGGSAAMDGDPATGSVFLIHIPKFDAPI